MSRFILRSALFVLLIFILAQFLSPFLYAKNFTDLLRKTKIPAQIEGEEQQIEIVQTKLSTENARPAKPGEVQIKFLYLWRVANKREGKNWHQKNRGFKQEQDLNLNFVFGVVPNLEFSTNMSYQYLTNKTNVDPDDHVEGPDKGEGLSTLPISFKWRFYENKKHKFAFAYLPGFTVPTGPNEKLDKIGLTQTYASFDETLVFTKNWKRTTASVDTGYSLPFGLRRDDRRGTLTSNFAVGYQIFKHLQPEIEINYKHRFYASITDSNSFAVTAGLLIPFYPRLLLMAGAQQVLFGNNTDQDFVLRSAVKVYL